MTNYRHIALFLKVVGVGGWGETHPKNLEKKKRPTSQIMKNENPNPCGGVGGCEVYLYL